jgi:hypothetical protein
MQYFSSVPAHPLVTGWGRIGVWPVTSPDCGDRLVWYEFGSPYVAEALYATGDRVVCRILHPSGGHIEIPMRGDDPDPSTAYVDVMRRLAGASVYREDHRDGR